MSISFATKVSTTGSVYNLDQRAVVVIIGLLSRCNQMSISFATKVSTMSEFIIQITKLF